MEEREKEPNEPIAIGDVVGGKYRVEQVIGHGSMGVVYAARHQELDERVALKFLSPWLATDETARARFQREAKNVYSLKSEHVARVFDVGRTETDVPFIVMEFLEGKTLKRHVDEHGKLALEEALSVLLQACEGIAEAHGRGIVHRDLKPENIFLTKLASGSPIVKVLDFGISKAAAGQKNMAITSQRQVLGTPRYMSPEQFDRSADVNAASDVWSLGVMAYWLLCGQFPFAGESPQEALAAVLSGDSPKPLSELGVEAGLETIVAKCLARKKEDRYVDAGELRRALAPFHRGSLVVPRDDKAPATHRSILSPRDAPTLEQPKSSLVTEVEEQRKKRAASMGVTTRSASEADALEKKPDQKKPDEEREEATKRLTPDVEVSAPLALTIEKDEKDEKEAGANPDKTDVMIGAPGADDKKPETIRMPAPKRQATTLPLGMVYSEHPPKVRSKSDAPSAPPPANEELDAEKNSVPLESNSRARIFIVVAIFVLVFIAVWMATTKM
jgi:serine/threonine-protein kinase